MRITKYNVMLDENRKNILVAESTKNYPSLGNAKAADKIVDIMNTVFEADRQAEEHIWLMAMDTKCKIIGIFEVTHGAVSTSVASTREIFVRLCLCGASIFALCHNHPSGDPSPSNEDCLFTKKLSDMEMGLLERHKKRETLVSLFVMSYVNRTVLNERHGNSRPL